MATENEQPSSSSDDIISLEDLVSAGAQASAPSAAEAVATIDQVLEVEDPSFAQEMKTIQSEAKVPAADIAVDAVVDTDVDALVQKEKLEQASRGLKKLKLLLIVRPWRKFLNGARQIKTLGPWLKLTAIPALKAGALKALQAVKDGFSWAVAKIKAGFAWFRAQSRQSKILMVAVLLLAVATVAMARLAIRGGFLPTLEKDFLRSFADGADAQFTYGDDEKWQDLNDPLLHPEHIVLLERLIVNLRNPGDGTNPMALLDLYVEAGSKDAAVEIKARDAEVRDMVLRTMEQMTYDELVTESGKNKLKVFLRKNLNETITQGRIRRLFFKSIVIKP
jgi:flagellar basal body-associated protein FliL